jgi:(2Fe-2S) ferredoxin
MGHRSHHKSLYPDQRFDAPDAQTFMMEGQFLGFLFKDGYKVKYLKVLAVNREWLIEVAKPLRADIRLDLPIGDWIQVSGYLKSSSKYGVPKLKAEHLQSITLQPGQSPEGHLTLGVQSKPEPKTGDRPKATSGKILVCSKSDCWKRGGKAVCAAIQDALGDRQLDQQVSVKTTGCMKHCKAGPNIVVMPDKARYSRLSAKDVAGVIDTHFVSVSEREPLGVH